MPDEPGKSAPSTTKAVESSVPPYEPAPGTGSPQGPNRRERRYEHRRGDPVYRPLRIYTLDPSTSQLDGATALVNVPYEDLEPGPEGRLFKIVSDGPGGSNQGRTKLDDPKVLLRNGYDPSPSNPDFRCQMLYAVCSNVYATFRAALGRDLDWGSPHSAAHRKLVIYPYDSGETHAYYDPDRHALHFGGEPAEDDAPERTLPGSMIYACLSHDIIAHELTHALLHGMRPHFLEPCSADTLAFHEAFADLVAIFQHFSYREVVLAEIRKERGTLEQARLLTGLARQFGHLTTDDDPSAQTDGKRASHADRHAVRSAIDVVQQDKEPPGYPEKLQAMNRDPDRPPHELGSVLVSAVFEAFITVYKRKTARYVRLATNGSGVLPEHGEIPVELQAILAEKASRLASQFLSICIRAIDYCPPVNLTFGEYLRALITADYNLVPDDPWAYREALIDAFRRRRIHPRDVASYAEDDLRWPMPPLEPDEAELAIEGLSFAELRFQGDPGRPFAPDEIERCSQALLDFVTASDARMVQFGLVPKGRVRRSDGRETEDEVGAPQVQSIRSARRVGPSGQVVFDIVAEVVQQRSVRDGRGEGECFEFHGGCTIILGPGGEVRYIIQKNVGDAERLERRLGFVGTDAARRYWVPKEQAGTGRRQAPDLFHRLDGRRAARPRQPSRS